MEFNISDFFFQIHGKFMPSALGFCAQKPRNWTQTTAYQIAPVILRRWVKLYQMFMFYSCQAFPWHPSHDIWYRLYIIKFQEAVNVIGTWSVCLLKCRIIIFNYIHIYNAVIPCRGKGRIRKWRKWVLKGTKWIWLDFKKIIWRKWPVYCMANLLYNPKLRFDVETSKKRWKSKLKYSLFLLGKVSIW